MIKDNKLYLTDGEIDITRIVLTEMMEFSKDESAEIMLKSIIGILDGLQKLPLTTIEISEDNPVKEKE